MFFWIASKAELIFSSAVISSKGLKTPAFRSLPVQAPRNSLDNQDAYSDPGTKLGVQNKDFRAASQTDITEGSVYNASQAIFKLTCDLAFFFRGKGRGRERVEK